MKDNQMAEWGSHLVSISPAGQVRLNKIAEETGRSVENLIAAAAEEEALKFFRSRNDDPAKNYRSETE
jgi:hypothetical protein